jgi:hypothetical protein
MKKTRDVAYGVHMCSGCNKPKELVTEPTEDGLGGKCFSCRGQGYYQNKKRRKEEKQNADLNADLKEEKENADLKQRSDVLTQEIALGICAKLSQHGVTRQTIWISDQLHEVGTSATQRVLLAAIAQGVRDRNKHLFDNEMLLWQVDNLNIEPTSPGKYNLRCEYTSWPMFADPVLHLPTWAHLRCKYILEAAARESEWASWKLDLDTPLNEYPKMLARLLHENLHQFDENHVCAVCGMRFMNATESKQEDFVSKQYCAVIIAEGKDEQPPHEQPPQCFTKFMEFVGFEGWKSMQHKDEVVNTFTGCVEAAAKDVDNHQQIPVGFSGLSQWCISSVKYCNYIRRFHPGLAKYLPGLSTKSFLRRRYEYLLNLPHLELSRQIKEHMPGTVEVPKTKKKKSRSSNQASVRQQGQKSSSGSTEAI